MEFYLNPLNNEWGIMFYANITGYARNSISWSWLLEKLFAAENNEVKYGWCFNYHNCRVSRFYNQGLTMDDVVYILTLQDSPRLRPFLQLMYTMVYKSACVYKLHSIAQNK